MPSPLLSRRVIASFRVVVILAVLRNATVICRVCGIQASSRGPGRSIRHIRPSASLLRGLVLKILRATVAVQQLYIPQLAGAHA